MTFRVSRMLLSTGFILTAASLASAQAQFRGLWVDCQHQALRSTTEIENVVQQAAAGHYNAIVAEVMAFQDHGSAAHGAYWNSSIVPKATDIVGGIDPLAYLCQRAAAYGIQVHAWLVTYRVSRSWPATDNTFLSGHPEYLMVPMAQMNTTATVGDEYVLDPGSPDVQNYLISIARELATNYPIHGINWDYIRYTQTDAGYPARTSYNYSSLKRFQRIYNRSDTPSVSDADWCNFRRRTINELIRRCRAELPGIWQNPNQPLMTSADVFASGSAPLQFESSAAYGYFQNWKYWCEQGWIDAVMPMNYKREHCPSEASGYRSWVDATANWRAQRYAVCGQATYLNDFAGSLAQMQYVASKNVQGVITYSYIATRATETICDDSDPWATDWTWYPYVASNIYASAASVPTMPWRDPATATEGTVWGQVLDAAGAPIDNATVSVNGSSGATDPNGYYVMTMVPTSGGVAYYSINVNIWGSPTLTYPSARILAGDSVRYDLRFNATAPQFVVSTSAFTHTLELNQPLAADMFTVRTGTGCGPLNYYITDNATWLTIKPSTGSSQGELDTISAQYNLAGLNVGTYSATIVLTDPAATNNPQTIAVTLNLLTPPIPGDLDGDNDVDTSDFGLMQVCFSGTGVAQTDPTCAGAKLDGDSDVDEADVLLFIGCIRGPSTLGDYNCLND